MAAGRRRSGRVVRYVARQLPLSLFRNRHGEKPLKRALVVMGTRPEAIKLAPVVRALMDADDYEPIVLTTGQHREMLSPVIERFGLPVHHKLDVMRADQPLASLTANLLDAVDPIIQREAPDITLVQGDTTSMLVGALCSFYRGIPVGHVEAGLRTGRMMAPFPEEANRVLATRLTHLHFAPTETARSQLLREEVDPETIFVTGNTVIDALQWELERQQNEREAHQLNAALAEKLGGEWRNRKIVLVTGHRRESFGRGFEEICSGISTLARRFPEVYFVYPVHLNPRVLDPVERILAGIRNVQLIEPIPYGPFVALLNSCHIVLTDSGGVQEEAPALGKPVLVMRETTERPEGVEAGTVILVGAERQSIVNHVARLLENETVYQKMAEAVNPYGDGQAAPRIVDAMRGFFGGDVPRPW